MSRKKEEPTIAVAATPRADLLPIAVKEAIKRRPIVRRLVVVVAFVLVLTLAAVAGATYLAVAAQQSLANEQARSEQLLAAQIEFAEARQISSDVDEAIAAQRVATLTEPDWNALLGEIRATLPAGVLLTSLSGTLSPTESAEEIPLRQDSVGSFSISAISDTVPNVESWIAELESLTGFAGIAPPVSVAGGSGSVYTVEIEVLINTDVFINRFAAEIDSAENEEGE